MTDTETKLDSSEPEDGSVAASNGLVGGARNGAIVPIPPSVVGAIARIMTSVDAVKKSQTNAHGGYKFASTDDIYAAVTRKMGEVGLVLLALEEHCDIRRLENKKGEMVQWAHLEFSFILATAEATWSDPRARRTLYIQVTGPQTFQAAQSYAEKSFLRSVFKLPTGDMDLDSLPQADSEEEQTALAANGRAPRKSSAEGKRDGSVKKFNEIRGEIQAAVSADHLQHLRTAYADDWSAMPARWAETLDEDYQSRMGDLRHLHSDAAE